MKLLRKAKSSGQVILDLSKNEIDYLPPQIGQLDKLKKLNLSGNKLTELPPQIRNLDKLEKLDVSDNELSALPDEIGDLSSLKILDIGGNKIKNLPRQIGNLKTLLGLGAGDNQLSAIPGSIGELENLQVLSLCNNQLYDLPHSIQKLKKLRILTVNKNRITALPSKISQLDNLEKFIFKDNTIHSPPPEIIRQGFNSIKNYLAAIETNLGQEQWISKLMIVGEGGVGKTSTLRSLTDKKYIKGLETTHGIEIDSYEFWYPYPKNVEIPKKAKTLEESVKRVRMQLKTWDFGGQEIYHATHQFFLSNRSLFLLVWNARTGFEAGKLGSWLNRIKSLAPESPIILVSTQIDEWEPQIPFSELQKKFPQIYCQCHISNLTQDGVLQLKKKVHEVTAKLPLMGEIWPKNWIEAAGNIDGINADYYSYKDTLKVLASHKVTGKDAESLLKWLNELGRILHFPEDENLKDIVLLKPEWASKTVGKILESNEVVKNHGVLTKEVMEKIWSNISDPLLQQRLIELMEKFDLSYTINEGKNKVCLIVEHLDFEPPEYEDLWMTKKEEKEITMRFHLDTIPAGIPTWFIARTNRFSTNLHWRYGVLLQDSPQKTHLGLVRCYTQDGYLELSVRGPFPQNFFALLKDGLELTLERFEGIEIGRTLPCPCRGAGICNHEFNYEDLQFRISKDKKNIECPKSLKLISVPRLLFGWEVSTQNQMFKTLEAALQKVLSNQKIQLNASNELLGLVQRNFLMEFRREQQKIDTFCPGIFTLKPSGSKKWNKNILGQSLDLQLYCEAPGQWHPALMDGKYTIEKADSFLGLMAPWLKGLCKVLKFVRPFAPPVLKEFLPKIDYSEMENELKLMAELITYLPEIKDIEEPVLEELQLEQDMSPAEIAVRRALYPLIDEKDPNHLWGGLQKTITPEGHIFWLCKHHAEKY